MAAGSHLSTLNGGFWSLSHRVVEGRGKGRGDEVRPIVLHVGYSVVGHR